jgi:hypothetical protein
MFKSVAKPSCFPSISQRPAHNPDLRIRGPFGLGDRVADPKPPQAAAVKNRGGERCEKVGTMIPAGKVERGERK